MNFSDYSRFDRVLSPVIVLSPALEFLYANGSASLQFPSLTSSDGLSLLFSQETRNVVSSNLAKGHAVSVPFPEFLGGSVLFDPVFAADGSLRHVYLYVESSSEYDSGLFSLFTHEELMRLLRREVLDPICELLQTVTMAGRTAAARSDPRLNQMLVSMRRRLLRSSLFLSGVEDTVDDKNAPFAICNVDELLALCAEQFPPLKYKGGHRPCFVPMQKDKLLRVLVNTLAAIYLRQDAGGKIVYSFREEEREIKLIFTADSISIPLNQPCAETSDSLNYGPGSVAQRITRFGGTVSIEPLSLRSARVILTFPKVRINFASVTVGDPFGDVLSFAARLALEYLESVYALRNPS